MGVLSVLPERWASVSLPEPVNLRATGVAEPLRRRVLQGQRAHNRTCVEAWAVARPPQRNFQQANA